MPARRPDVSVVTSGHDLADARLHREVEALCRAGLRVEVWGLGDPATAPPGARVHALLRGGLRRRAWYAMSLPFRARGRVVLTLDPDLVPAATLTRIRRPLVVDVHEDYLRLLSDRVWARGLAGRFAVVLVRAATALSARADLTVVADAHVPPAAATRRVVVRNVPSPAHLPAPSSPDDHPRALYVGDVRRSRGLFTMLDAIERAPGWLLDVVGPVAAGDVARLERWKAESPAAGRVTFHGRMPPAQAWELAQGAWCGLALLEDTPAFREAIPTKLYEYLAAGLAVVVTPLPRMAALVNDSGAGRVARDAGEVSDTLREWSSGPSAHGGALAEARANAVRWAAAFGGPSPYDLLAAEVRALLAGSSGPRDGLTTETEPTPS